jgi:hypothetical protein
LAWRAPEGYSWVDRRGAQVTTSPAYKIGAVVCVHAKAMKEPWCLAVSNAEASTAMQVNYYAKRWTIEPNFRDTKDLRFGMGLGTTRIGEPTRRDRLLLINAFAMVLLTMLGAAGEPAKASVWIDYLSPTRRRSAPIRCSGKPACSANRSQPCQIKDYSRLWPASPRPYQNAVRSADFLMSFEMSIYPAYYDT